MDVLFEISRILNTGLDMETLSICVRLCEQGINPEALSSVIKELRKATEALKAAENMTGWHGRRLLDEKNAKLKLTEALKIATIRKTVK